MRIGRNIFIPLTLIVATLLQSVFFVQVAEAAPSCPPGTEQTYIQAELKENQIACQAVGEGATGETVIYETDASGNVSVITNVNPGTGTSYSQPSADVCSLNPIYFSLDTCMKSFMSWIGSWWLTLGGGILRLAGTLFDTLVYRVIVDFKHTLEFLNIESAISTGWTVFRDFSNILIIGFFVFISISIILGLEEFGQKKLIARVLIIAVLINFSLLFTKIIIDTSNFMAFQIYRQMAGGTQVANFDIAQGFLNPMGIDKIWDTQKVTDLVKTNSGSGLQAFFFGLVGGLMLMAVAGVLLYGCFLIIARGVLFIFLMLTAALAFATYLIPSLEHGEYGWSAWWKSLFNSAIFAPLLMLFLFVSLTIVNAAGKQLGGTTSAGAATLGSVISDPQSQLTTSAWAVIMLYMLGTGLLFLSMKMSSKFAGKISGFSLLAAMPGLAKVPLGLGALAGAGTFGSIARNTVGRSAAKQSEKLGESIKQRSLIAANPNLDAATRAMHQREIAAMQKQKTALDARAGRDFNILNNALGKAIAKPLGVDVTKSKGGFMGPRKAAAEEAAKATQGLAISRGEASKEAQKIVAEQQKDTRAAITSQKQASEALVSAARELAEAEKKQSSHQSELDRAAEEANRAQQKKVAIEDQHTQGVISRAERDQQIQAEDAKIKDAHSNIVAARAGLKSIESKHLGTAEVKAAEAIIKETNDQISALNRAAEKQVKTLADNVVEQGLKNAETIAADLHHLDEFETKLASKQIRKTYGNQRLTETFKALQKETAETPDESKKA